MAVNGKTPEKPASPSTSGFGGRHLLIGSNVLISVIAAVGIVIFVQWASFDNSTKFDLTDQGVNSLTTGTERLLDGLETPVRLTAMYFETDLEHEDQVKYRTKINDLINLFQSANRSGIEIDAFNPLQEHGKRERFIERLQNLEKFKTESEDHRAFIEKFRNEVSTEIGTLIQEQLEQIAALQTGTLGELEQGDLAQVREVLTRWQNELTAVTSDVVEAIEAAQPRFGPAASTISTTYRNIARDLKAIIEFGKKLSARRTDTEPAVQDFLGGLEAEYQTVIDTIEAEATAGRELPTLELESILRQLGPTANTLVVETEADARVVSFNDIWPPFEPNMPAAAAAFKDRSFKGEEKITSAILRLTEKEQTAVIFVRYAGNPLFFGGFPGRRQAAPYTQMKGLLEDNNFIVKEWDLATAEEPPTFDTEPAKRIYVVLRPNQPAQGLMARTRQQSFNDTHKQKVLDQLGDAPLAVFIAGWAPGPFGAFPAPYEYEDYLNEQWGIRVAADELLIRTFAGERPGEWYLAQASFFHNEFSRSDHLLTKDLRGRQLSLPSIAPLEIAAEPPEGVSIDRLISAERAENLWAVRNIQAYIEKAQRRESVAKLADDRFGPFTVAAVAEKGDDGGKIVVISSRDCMVDQVAMAPAMTLTAQGIVMRQRNPGNIALFLNTLRWLNGRTEWMAVGIPVDVATIEIEEGPALSFIKVFVGGLWPATALACGVVAWWVRRR